MRITSPLPQKKARLEIIPLIDIMFFLLASFMMVTLTMTKQHTISVNLPAASNTTTNLKPDNITLAVTASGQVMLEKKAVTLDELAAELKTRLAANKELPVYISGDTAAGWSSMMAVLDYVRRCGVTKVAFNVKPAT